MESDILLRRQLSQPGTEQDMFPSIDFSEINKITDTGSQSGNQQLFTESLLSHTNVNNFHSYAKIQDGVPGNELKLPHSQFITTAVQSATSVAQAPTMISDALVGGAPIIHIPASVEMPSNFGSIGSNTEAVPVQIHLNNTSAYQSVLENIIAAAGPDVQMVEPVETAMETETNRNGSQEYNSAIPVSATNPLPVFSDVLCNVQLMTFSYDNQEPRMKLVRVTDAIVLSVQFICKACGKDFLSAEDLRVHNKSHTSEAPTQSGNLVVSNALEGNAALNKTSVHLKVQDLVNSNINYQHLASTSQNVTNVGSQGVDNNAYSAYYMGHQIGEGDSSTHNRTCFICKNMFASSQLWHHYCTVHMKDNSGFQCFMCGKELANEKDLLHHMMSLHSRLKEPVLFCCAVCDKRFDSETFLLNHMLHDHPVNDGPDNILTLPIGRKATSKSSGSTEKPVKLSCAQCEGTGVVSSRKNPCRICGKVFWDSRQLTRHLSEHTEQTLCTVCHKLIFLKSLPKHMTLHTKPKSFECPECKKAYRDKCDLTKHMRIHTGEKPYTCEICHKSFTHSSQLPRHLRTHTGEKPFKCELCNKMFSRRFGLHQHMSSHSVDKLFKCPHCDKDFRNRKGLQKHACKHLPETTF